MDSFVCSGCKKSFKNEQGVGKHETTRPVAQVMKKQKMTAEINSNSKIEQMHQETIVAGRDASHSYSGQIYDKRKDATKNAVMLVEASETNCESSSSSETNHTKVDNRKSNRGRSRRNRRSNKHKACMIEFYEKESSGLNVAQFCKKTQASVQHDKEFEHW